MTPKKYDMITLISTVAGLVVRTACDLGAEWDPVASTSLSVIE